MVRKLAVLSRLVCLGLMSGCTVLDETELVDKSIFAHTEVQGVIEDTDQIVVLHRFGDPQYDETTMITSAEEIDNFVEALDALRVVRVTDMSEVAPGGTLVYTLYHEDQLIYELEFTGDLEYVCLPDKETVLVVENAQQLSELTIISE